MNEVSIKKVCIIGGIIIGLIILSFFIGSISASRGLKELESGANRTQQLLDSETRRAESILRGLRQADLEIGGLVFRSKELELSIELLTSENKRITEEIRNVSEGFEADQNRIRSVTKGIQRYLDKVEQQDQGIIDN